MITEKDKKLLLNDICARLLYGVKVHITNDCFYDKREPYDTILTIQSSHLLKDLDRETGPDAIIIEPYLRPMSSMTEEERNNLRAYCRTQEGIIYDIGVAGAINSPAIIDFLNTYHFDYHGLIEKGLALEAPEGMYKTKSL